MTPAKRTLGILFFALVAGCAGVQEAPPSPLAQAQSPPVEAAPVEPKLEEAVAAAPPPAKVPAKVSVPPVAMAQPRKVEASVPVAKPLEPTLDVAALTARLRDTKAIGVFTKLALKNQVDDLLKQFRTLHQGGQQPGVASLRQPYNMLILKVLSLVQDSDPSLARTIAGSREAIWGILADRDKFSSVT